MDKNVKNEDAFAKAIPAFYLTWLLFRLIRGLFVFIYVLFYVFKDFVILLLY